VVLSEEFVLRDGSRLRGRIIGLNAECFYLSTSMGEVRVPRMAISSIQFVESEPAAPQPEEAPRAVPPAVARAAKPVSESPAALEGELYTHPTGRFQLRVPPGWTLDEALTKTGEESTAGFVSPERALIVLVTAEVFSGSLETYVSLAEIQYRNAFADYEKLVESPLEADGRRGVRLVWRAISPHAGNAPISSVVAVIPYPGRVVRISCISPTALFDPNLPLFEAIFASYASTPF
jgi:hypothetical protein